MQVPIGADFIQTPGVCRGVVLCMAARLPLPLPLPLPLLSRCCPAAAALLLLLCCPCSNVLYSWVRNNV